MKIVKDVQCTTGGHMMSKFGTENKGSCSIDYRSLQHIQLLCPCVCVLNCFSQIRLFETLWTVACQGLLSMGFSRQEYWSRSPCPLPGNLASPGLSTKKEDNLSVAS